MSRSSFSFVEWKEQYVSQEKGRRVVHYLLKDSSGEFILAVIGTERSLRHMVYVVADEFLNVYGTENAVQAGLKWKSRREVVDWLTSMLCKQQIQDLTKADATQIIRSSDVLFTRLSNKQVHGEDNMGDRAKSLKQAGSDILWLGVAWVCRKQLKHYPAFTRNGTTITIQSFVLVMAKEGSRYVAYLEDMYEDKKGQKKVKVRWFHRCQEVKGVITVRNAHPKEVFITPHTQVISAECVDGPTVVLNREHFEKCRFTFQCSLPEKIHLCFRQFRNNKIKSFDLSKLRGYFDQPILSSLASDDFVKTSSMDCGITGEDVKAFGIGKNVMVGTKRSRSFGQQSSLTGHSCPGQHGNKVLSRILCQNRKYDLSGRRFLTSKDDEWKHWYIQLFKVDEKIELLCQDSGIRGCWFRCTILEVSRKQIKVRYDDVEDQDGCGNLEEWVPAFRLASPDKLGMRCPKRPTIRPCRATAADPEYVSLEVGAAVDAWWSDGWWEGVVATIKDVASDHLQVYIPGENLFLDVMRTDIRVSRDWVEGQWVDIKKKPEMLPGATTPEIKVSIASTHTKVEKPDDLSISNHDVIVSPAMDDVPGSVNQVGNNNHKGENGDCVTDVIGGNEDGNNDEPNDNNDGTDCINEPQWNVQDLEELKKSEAVAPMEFAT
ncbi:hypothetical protein Dimus_019210 [Dionaea muscipula]